MATAVENSAVAAAMLALQMRHWRTSLAGGLLVTVAVAWALSAYSAGAIHLWLWALLCGLGYAALGLICLRMERQPELNSEPTLLRWLMVILPASMGVLWSSLPYWLPGHETNLQLLAALLAGVVVIGASSAAASQATLFAWTLPVLAIMPAALAWHADLPVAAASVLLVVLLILRYGIRLQHAMADTIRQRQRAEALYNDLTAQQARLRDLERTQTLDTERRRLLLDMHDGLGSRLVSALAVAERGRAQPGELADELRECINDLRTVIDSLEPANNDLVSLLATLRFRFEQPLQRAGITLVWRVNDLPPLTWVGPPEVLQVMRMVQEIMANILKHASACRVVVTTRQVDEDVELTIIDDGGGFDPGEPSSGRGLRFLQQRADKLRGRLEITSHPGAGTTVRLRLPIHLT